MPVSKVQVVIDVDLGSSEDLCLRFLEPELVSTELTFQFLLLLVVVLIAAVLVWRLLLPTPIQLA